MIVTGPSGASCGAHENCPALSGSAMFVAGGGEGVAAATAKPSGSAKAHLIYAVIGHPVVSAYAGTDGAPILLA
jgi:hypothetical protein